MLQENDKLSNNKTSAVLAGVVKEVFRSFTEVKVLIPHCIMKRVKALHWQCYLSKSIKVQSGKCIEILKVKVLMQKSLNELSKSKQLK